MFANYFNAVEYLFSKYPTAIFLLFGDSNLPPANSCNIDSFFTVELPYLNLSRVNKIRNSKDVMLDYILTNSTLIDVQQNLNLLISVDQLNTPIYVTFVHNSTDALPFLEDIYKWNLSDYKSILSLII